MEQIRDKRMQNDLKIIRVIEIIRPDRIFTEVARCGTAAR